MNAEIELKLFFFPQDQVILINALNGLEHATPQGERRLVNGYFDTPDLQLRRWNMGLRVRGDNDHREQTLKTAGQVVGGIHSRPEYNVTIQSERPDLRLFPANIWPADCALASLQTQLCCVFHTDFTRRAWHVRVADSVVEVALDLGEISASGRRQPLCEIEFELLSGETEALLTLACEVARQVPVRLGKASKAQRGYELAGKQPLPSLNFPPFPPLSCAAFPMAPLQGACVQLLQTALEQWQLLEASLSEQPAESLSLRLMRWEQMRACIRMLHMTLNQFNVLSTEVAQYFAEVEQHLAFIEKALALTTLLNGEQVLLAELAQVGEQREIARLRQDFQRQLDELDLAAQLPLLWQKRAYGQLQLSIVEILLQLAVAPLPLGDTLAEHARAAQHRYWQPIFEWMSHAQTIEYEGAQGFRLLTDGLLVGQMYGVLYDEKAREAFRQPWQDIVLENYTLACYRTVMLTANQLEIDISQWGKDKLSRLLARLALLRQQGLQQKMYW